jgi:UTP:GlnB (protein PII) uridylyltransferase
MSLTSILYNMGVDIKSIHAETQPDNTVIDRFIIETDEDDYYIYDRLESRLKFEIPELIEVELIAVH